MMYLALASVNDYYEKVSDNYPDIKIVHQKSFTVNMIGNLVLMEFYAEWGDCNGPCRP